MYSWGDLASPRTVAKIIFLPEGGWKLVVHRAVEASDSVQNRVDLELRSDSEATVRLNFSST